jgi:hypothetical protein
MKKNAEHKAEKWIIYTEYITLHTHSCRLVSPFIPCVMYLDTVFLLAVFLYVVDVKFLLVGQPK